MKRKIVITVIAVVLSALTGVILFLCRQQSVPASLQVNNIAISNENIQIIPNRGRDNATVPMFATLQALGVSIDWQNENDAIISYLDKQFLFSVDKMTFVDENTSFEYMNSLADFSYYCREYVGDDIIIDDETMSWLIHCLGLRIETDINYLKREIIITRVNI